MITFVNLNPPKGEVIFAIYSSKLVVNTNVQSKRGTLIQNTLTSEYDEPLVSIYLNGHITYVIIELEIRPLRPLTVGLIFLYSPAPSHPLPGPALPCCRTHLESQD